MIRCYNCGAEGHRTQHCTQYEPYYCEPGKASQDYREQTMRIAHLFAEDIIREHQAGHRDQAQGEAEAPGLPAATSAEGTSD